MERREKWVVGSSVVFVVSGLETMPVFLFFFSFSFPTPPSIPSVSSAQLCLTEGVQELIKRVRKLFRTERGGKKLDNCSTRILSRQNIVSVEQIRVY